MSKLIIDCLIYKKNKAFGFQEYLFNLLNSFFINRDSISFEEIIIVCDETQQGDFNKFSSKLSVKGYFIKNKLHQIYLQNKLSSLLNLNLNDLILYPYNYSAFSKKTKSLLVIHDLLYLRKNYMENKFMHLQRKIFIPVSLKKADKIIAISHFTKKDILNHFPKIKEENIRAIYNYFNFEKYNTAEKNKPDIKHPFILTVSTFQKYKNTIVILKMFNEICEKGYEYNLVLVGSPDKMNEELKEYYENMPAQIKNRIIFQEKISNDLLASLYLNCSVFILATKFEGLGMPIVEAMYFNAPTVLSNIDICKEVSFNKAIYFDPDNYKVLVNVLIENNLNLPRPNNREEILNVFSEKNTSGKYIELINSFHD